jgi:hypothetical protein
LVDALASKLSDLTGTRFEVLRERRVYSAQHPTSFVMRYYLRATHRGVAHTFGGYRGFTIDEMKYYLASLCDLIEMGFVPVSAMQRILRSEENSRVARREESSPDPTPSDRG